jgi:hypothetical protein
MRDQRYQSINRKKGLAHSEMYNYGGRNKTNRSEEKKSKKKREKKRGEAERFKSR